MSNYKGIDKKRFIFGGMSKPDLSGNLALINKLFT